MSLRLPDSEAEIRFFEGECDTLRGENDSLKDNFVDLEQKFKQARTHTQQKTIPTQIFTNSSHVNHPCVNQPKSVHHSSSDHHSSSVQHSSNVPYSSNVNRQNMNSQTNNVCNSVDTNTHHDTTIPAGIR